jgi:predicted nucleotide-binding protein (sugar kinase/HSP70/actin superfamily)
MSSNGTTITPEYSSGGSHMPFASNGGLVQIGQTEDFIAQRLRAERVRLENELGIQKKEIRHFFKPKENPFTEQQRGHTTLLFGGLTWKHEKLIHAALERLGYRSEVVPTPNVAAFQLGKEFGNNGQCNPTYFTVGNLVQFLQELEKKGMTKQDIIDSYVFLTAGACGPCRFGMYEAEYRLALRNSGFNGFRVLLFQQSGGLSQGEAKAGLEMNLDFFLGILNAMNMGDLLNDVLYQIRPYEVHKGEADRVFEECMDLMAEALKKSRPYRLEGRLASFFQRFPKCGDAAEYIGKFLNQLYGDEYTSALREVRDRLNAVEVDRTRVKPMVKITGEFWAQTTEGDGNFNMFKFLEKEGAQVMVEPVGTWINYMIHQARNSIVDRKGVEEGVQAPPSWRLDKVLAQNWNYRNRIAKLSLAEAIFKREWNRLREALNYIPHELADQKELERLAHAFYHTRAAGGEGHLEVAKNIYYCTKHISHMVLSLKPFGCMPSTQSDGAQSAVVAHFKDMIFLPIETSGEGEINAHSRVQMALGEAKVKAKQEFEKVVQETGYSLKEIRVYVEDHPQLKQAMYPVPHSEGIIGTAANFVVHVASLMKADKSLRVAVA